MNDRPDASSLLSDLIAFDTTSRNSNLELVEFVVSMLEPFGIHPELTYDDNRKKANLFATIGDSREPGIVLSGHTDVVPVDGQDWSSDPFATEIRDQRLYGRGASDMKGFIAICLTRIRDILEADLEIPVHFAFSYDEEVGCLGVVKLLESLCARPVLPRACIIGEPTSMGVVRAHKGMFFKRCCVHGKSAHSSMVDQGVNAVTIASRIIAKVDDLQRRIRREGPFDPEFSPPYTTLHCGVIHGGSVNNIIPALCQFDFEIRSLPGQLPEPLFEEVQQYIKEVLLPDMHSVDESTGVDWQGLAGFPGMDTDIEDPLVHEISGLLGTSDRPGKVSYGTEGGRYHEAGIPTIICGPGSIAQAHRPDEFIDLSQIAKGERFVDALISSLK